MDVVALEEVEVRRRIERAKVAIGEERIRGGQVEATAEHRLEGVARRDVILDAADVRLEAGIGIGRRRRRKRGTRLDREGLDIRRPGQALEPSVDSLFRSGEQPAQLAVARPGGHFHARDHRRPVVEIVEDQQRVCHHDDGVGQLPVVPWGVGKRLDRAHDVVAEVADRAPGESRQPRHDHRRVLPHEAAEVLQWGQVGLRRSPAAAGSPAVADTPPVAIDLSRLGSQKGVARPALAALERFEEETVGASMQLGEGRHRRIAVEHDLAGDWHHPAAPSSLGGEGREPLAHRGGAATRCRPGPGIWALSTSSAGRVGSNGASMPLGWTCQIASARSKATSFP